MFPVCPSPFDLQKVEVASYSPRIYVYPDFLTDEECDYIIRLGYQQGLKRSEVASGNADTKSDQRTSYGTFLHVRDEVLSQIEDKIAAWTQIPKTHGEPFYLLRYEEGQEYKPHWDYFDASLPGMEKYIGAPGQRTATVLLYLATPEEGGETVFPKAEIAVPAVRGTAVLFWGHTGDHQLDDMSLHGGMPVKAGVKYCCTKWLRENRWTS